MVASLAIILISALIIVSVLLFYILSLGKYRELMKPLNKKNYAFLFMLPAGLYLMDKLKISKLSGDTRLRQNFAELYGDKYAKFYLKIHTANKFATAMLFVFLLSVVSLYLNVQSITAVNESPLAFLNGNVIARPPFNPDTYKNGTVTVKGQAEIDDNGTKTVEQFDINANPQVPDDKTCVDLVVKDLEDNYIQANKAAFENGISSGLNFTQFGTQLGCQITLKTGEEQGYLSETGGLTQPEPGTQPAVVQASLLVSKGDITEQTSAFSIKILPAVDSVARPDPVKDFDQAVQDMNKNPNTANNDPIILPETVDSAAVTYSQPPEPADNTKYIVFISCIFAVIAVFMLLDRDVDNSIKKKRELIKNDFPEFVNKYALLLGCGLTTYDAFYKIMTDNKSISNTFEHHPIYMELETTLREIDLGKAEVHAYEDFGLRCRITEAMKFSSLVTQNLRRGTNDLLMQLKEQVSDVWQMHKANIRRKGEEAGTLMMLPMMLSLVSVLLVVIYPAFASIKF